MATDEMQAEEHSLQGLAKLLEENGKLIAQLAVLRETRTEAGLDDAERAMLLTVRQNIAEAALQLPGLINPDVPWAAIRTRMAQQEAPDMSAPVHEEAAATADKETVQGDGVVDDIPSDAKPAALTDAHMAALRYRLHVATQPASHAAAAPGGGARPPPFARPSSLASATNESLAMHHNMLMQQGGVAAAAAVGGLTPQQQQQLLHAQTLKQQQQQQQQQLWMQQQQLQQQQVQASHMNAHAVGQQFLGQHMSGQHMSGQHMSGQQFGQQQQQSMQHMPSVYQPHAYASQQQQQMQPQQQQSMQQPKHVGGANGGAVIKTEHAIKLLYPKLPREAQLHIKQQIHAKVPAETILANIVQYQSTARFGQQRQEQPSAVAMGGSGVQAGVGHDVQQQQQQQQAGGVPFFMQ